MVRKGKSATGRNAVDHGPRFQKEATCHRLVGQRPLAVAVSVRRQTPEEERRFTAALNLLVAELVRQHLGRGGKLQ